MSSGLKDRSEINCVYVHGFQMGDPVYDLSDTGNRLAVKFGTGALAAAEAHRINVIDRGFFDPLR